MKVPYNQYAYIRNNKIEKYLISLTHNVGKHKSFVFRRRGFDETNMDKLKQELLKIIHTCEYSKRTPDSNGIKYKVNGIINTPDGRTINLTTVWIVDTGRRSPRLITAYPV